MIATSEVFTYLDENYVSEQEAAKELGLSWSYFNQCVATNKWGLKDKQAKTSRHIHRKLWLKSDIKAVKDERK